jgi:Ankyrin repeats (3 copies)
MHRLLIAKNLSPAAYTGALRFIPALGDVNLVRMMLDRGADPNAVDPLGRTPLMSAVLSDFPSLDVVKLLVEQGGNVNARSQHKESGDSGRTVLDLAKLRGNTPIVDLLIKSGASATRAIPFRFETTACKHHSSCDSTQPSSAAAHRCQFYFESWLCVVSQRQPSGYGRWACA